MLPESLLYSLAESTKATAIGKNISFPGAASSATFYSYVGVDPPGNAFDTSHGSSALGN